MNKLISLMMVVCVVSLFRIAKNGTTLAGSQIRRKIGTGADVASLGLGYIVELAPTDYVEVFVSCDTSNTEITASDMFVSLISIGDSS